MKRALFFALRLSARTWLRVPLMFGGYWPEMACTAPPRRILGGGGALMIARTVLILGITLGVLGATDTNISAAADRRAQAMRFELLHEGPAEACASSRDAWVSATGVITE